MKNLKKDWITDGMIDFEYKKYLLLAYLKAVQTNFGQKKLYPDYSELHQHYHYTSSLRDEKLQLKRQFSKTLIGIDWANVALQYQSGAADTEHLLEIEQIIDFSLPKFQRALSGGREIFEEVDGSLQVSPIGIVPLNTSEGYLFLFEHVLNETRIYYFKVTIFDVDIPPSRRVQTVYLDTVRRSLTTSFEQLKLDLVRKNKDLPNPATYMVESRLSYPLEETLLPIAKKKIAKLLE
ncbi:MAG: hypothetical protein U0Y10_19105 [Spirosomataceae bacterium]